jgi:hypothetical protein
MVFLRSGLSILGDEQMKAMNGRGRKEGSAFLIVMGIVGLLMIAGLSMTMMTGNSAFTSRKLLAGEQALGCAEAGVADTIVKMSSNYVYWMQTDHSGSYAGGTYSVETTLDTSTAFVVISSVGVFDGSTRRTALELLGTLWDLYDMTIGVAGAIVCGGDATLETSAMRVYGGIHSNGDIINNSGNPKIEGDVTAVGSCDLTAETGFTATSNAAPLVIPTYLPLDPWKALAQAGGLYYTNDQVFGGIALEPSNGVVYVDGSVEIANQSTMIGTLVASENITINNRFEQTPFNTNWPCLLAGIDVNLHNRNSYIGVIFAAGSVTMRNRRTINGSIIAIGEVLIENGATIDPLDFPPSWSPDDTNDVLPQVIIGGWLE